jgi:hypothetical protein
MRYKVFVCTSVEVEASDTTDACEKASDRFYDIPSDEFEITAEDWFD